ncbi:MAG: delta-60 repeat domain-containing protein, partial [Casimicrobium sp.]
CTVRYGSNGSLDSTWGGTGVAIATFFTSGATARAVLVRPDDKVIVVGYCTIDFGVTAFCTVRYNANGTLDTSWGDSGTTFTTPILNAINVATSVAATNDGRIIVAGYCGSPSKICSVRYDALGQLDSGWGGNGVVVTTIADNQSGANAVLVQADQRVVVTGDCFGGSVNGICSVRYLSGGGIDNTWNQLGYTIATGGAGAGSGNAIAQQPDGKIVIAGSCSAGISNSFCSLRYLSDGKPDLSWRGTGFAATAMGAGDGATAVAIQSDGRIVMGGYCGGGLNVDFCAIRYDGGLPTPSACSLDVDGDGRASAMSDALLQIRTSLGLYGATLTAGIEFPNDATRKNWPLIREYLRVNTNDFDGDGRVLAETDGIIQARLTLGFLGDAVIDGVQFSGAATRTTWNDIRVFANTSCGLSLP